MTPTIYIEDFAPYRYLVDALLCAKPDLAVEVRPFAELDHPVARETQFLSLFMAYRDELPDPTYSFPAVAGAMDRRFTGLNLCGDTALNRGTVRSLSQVIDEGHLMMAAGHVAQLPGYEGPMWHEGSRAAEAYLETYAKKMKIVERYAGEGDFLLGDELRLPDIIVAACCWFAQDMGFAAMPDECPRLAAWHKAHIQTGLWHRNGA